MKWTKLLLNIQANAIPAILDMAPDDVYAHPALFVLERAAFREALAVMRALHLRVVSFPNYPVPLLAWAMQHLPTVLLRPLLSPPGGFRSGRQETIAADGLGGWPATIRGAVPQRRHRQLC